MPQAALFADALPPVQNPHQLLIDTWDRLWRETRGVRWSWTAKDAACVKRTLRDRAHGDPGPVLELIALLLQAPPRPWYESEASPAILYSHWPQLTAHYAKARRIGAGGPVNQPRPIAEAERPCNVCGHKNPITAIRCAYCARPTVQ